MNKLVFTALGAALAGVILAPPARAGDEVAAAIGGFIGGVIVGSAAGHRHDPPPRYDRDCPPPRGGQVSIDGRGRRSGHWEWVQVRTWVPGHYSFSYDNCGRRFRTWVPGRHEFRRERVWVDHDRRGDRRYEGYAYDRR